MAVGTGVGASRRGTGLGCVGRVGRVWVRAGVWACGSKFLVFGFLFLSFIFSKI